jgi:hypothetical protein
MKIINKPISVNELEEIAQERFGEMTKAVVDLEKEIMVVDADLHADQEALLLQQGSKQKNLWGINLYPELYGEDDFVEFDSMINLRPSWGNNSRGVESPEIREKIRKIVGNLIVL